MDLHHRRHFDGRRLAPGLCLHHKLANHCQVAQRRREVSRTRKTQGGLGRDERRRVHVGQRARNVCGPEVLALLCV